MYFVELACQVCANIVDDDQRAWKQEPDDAVKNVGHKKGGGHENKQQDQVHPGVLTELHQIVSFLQLQNKGYKTCRAFQSDLSHLYFQMVVRSDPDSEPKSYS